MKVYTHIFHEGRHVVFVYLIKRRGQSTGHRSQVRGHRLLVRSPVTGHKNINAVATCPAAGHGLK